MLGWVGGRTRRDTPTRRDAKNQTDGWFLSFARVRCIDGRTGTRAWGTQRCAWGTHRGDDGNRATARWLSDAKRVRRIETRERARRATGGGNRGNQLISIHSFIHRIDDVGGRSDDEEPKRE